MSKASARTVDNNTVCLDAKTFAIDMTIFGWVLLGSISSGVSQPLQSFLALDSLDVAVNKFWQLEEVSPDTSYSKEDKR